MAFDITDADLRAALVEYDKGRQLYNDMMREPIGLDADRDLLTKLTPLGGAALSLGYPTELRTVGTTSRMAMLRDNAIAAVKMLNQWAEWVDREGGRDYPATSVFDQVCRPTLGAGSAERVWSSVGGAYITAITMQSSLNLDAKGETPQARFLRYVVGYFEPLIQLTKPKPEAPE